MRISIHTLGTRGDVQPYLALARELARRGHEPLLVAPAQFAGMAQAQEIAYAPLPAAFLEILNSAEAKQAIGRSNGGFGAGFKLLKHYIGLMGDLFDQEWAAAQAFAPDLVLFHPKSLAAPHIATRLGVASILASPLPGFTPTAAFPTPILPFTNLGPLNRASHALMIHGGNVIFGRAIGKWRQDRLGLTRQVRVRPPAATLYGYSPHLLPKPTDWGPSVLVTGFWTLEAPEWVPDGALAEFLAAGETPVFVGFGSMPEADPAGLTEIVVAGLRGVGKRGLLAVAGGALVDRDHGPDMFTIGGAPHDRLFPLVHSTIHHGGAGTTGAALRAGKPTAICPFLGDQPFWGRRVANIGAGPKPLHKKTLTPETIAEAARAMDEPRMRRRAAELGTAIRAENGVARAVDVIEEAAGAWRQSK